MVNWHITMEEEENGGKKELGIGWMKIKSCQECKGEA